MKKYTRLRYDLLLPDADWADEYDDLIFRSVGTVKLWKKLVRKLVPHFRVGKKGFESYVTKTLLEHFKYEKV